MQAISWTLKEQVKFDEHGIASVDWDHYPILKFSELPEIEADLVDARRQSLAGRRRMHGGTDGRGDRQRRRPCAGRAHQRHAADARAHHVGAAQMTPQTGARPQPARPPALPADPQAAAAEAARRRARRGLDHRQCRELEPARRHAAHRAAAADGPAAAARRAQLVVARIRHAGRLLAFPRGAGQPQAQGDLCAERHGDRALPRGLPGRARGRLGFHGPRLRAAADAPGRRSARRPSPTPSPRSRASPASRRAAGRARASPRPTTRSTYLAEAGIEYVADWVLDDQPVALKTTQAARSSRCPTPSRSTTW